MVGNMLKETDVGEYSEGHVKQDLFAVSRIFAAARKRMNLAEWKTLVLALASIRWTEKCPGVLYLDKKEVASAVGVNSDSNHLSVDLRRSIGEMARHSYIEFSVKDGGTWINGCFVSTIAMFKNVVRIRMNPDYLDLFGNLDKDYITMWSGDIYKMRSERSVEFYELLRENSDTRLPSNSGTMSIRKFKEMFKMPKDGPGSYTRKSGHFNRTEFEKRVIDPICEDLSKTDMIRLVAQPGGKHYEKIRQGNRIMAYRFYWTMSMHPRVASAPEVKRVQDRVDKNPEVLKVARDILKGEDGRKAGEGSRNAFNRYRQHDYDFDAIMAAVVDNK